MPPANPYPIKVLAFTLVGFILATVLIISLGCGRSIEAESSSDDGINMNCGDGVSCTQPCFCERTCVLWWCWGKPYCECRS